MGFYDRPYYGEQPSGFSMKDRLSAWSVNTWIIVICIAVFVIDALLRTWVADVAVGPLERWGRFTVAEAIKHLQVWRFVTFQFLHRQQGDWYLLHIVFNMIALFFFGPMVESYLGSRRYLGFYLLCGIAGPVIYMALWAIKLVEAGSHSSLIGASAGVFGVLVAAARIAPDTRVMLLFPPIPMRLKTMAWMLVGIAAFMVLTRGANQGGEAAHLGGAAMGFYLIRRASLLDFFARLKLPRVRFGSSNPARPKRPKPARGRPPGAPAAEPNDRRMTLEVDRILAKVHEQGLASLTEKEKRTLKKATERERSA